MLQWEKVELIAGIITSRRLEAPAPSSLEYLGHSLNLPSYQGTTNVRLVTTLAQEKPGVIEYIETSVNLIVGRDRLVY